VARAASHAHDDSVAGKAYQDMPQGDTFLASLRLGHVADARSSTFASVWGAGRYQTRSLRTRNKRSASTSASACKKGALG
jgi:hypothetical protein